MKQFLLIFFTLFFSEFHPLQNRIAYFGLFERRIKNHNCVCPDRFNEISIWFEFFFS